MIALLFVAMLGAAVVQAAVAPALFAHPLAAPVLPVAVVTGWAVIRGVDETWPALVLPAVLLGVVSEERVGWFLIALLPGPALAALLVARMEPQRLGLSRRALMAALGAAGGTLAYGFVLVTAAGVASEALDRAAEFIGGAAVTGGIAALAAAAFWPLRERERGLFV
jgi:hypothetical protein